MTLDTTLKLPSYESFSQAISSLDLPISSSGLHGVMCGYLSTGASRSAETYVRALMAQQHDDGTRTAARALFNLLAITEQQMTQQQYEFEILLPDEHQRLIDRAKAFSEWCEGYSQGAMMGGIDEHEFEDEETKEAYEHILEFANLDYEAIDVSHDDERSFMEVCEYTRIAVMHIHTDLQLNPILADDNMDSH